MATREAGLNRLSGTDIDINDRNYLHYISFHKELKDAIDKYANGDLLDIGCGNKPYESLLAKKVKKYIGVDIAQSNLNKVDIIAEANNIPLEKDSFDTIISTQTIEHVEDHQGLINEAFRLLKPGGYFILSGPFYWPLHEEPYDFFRFTKHGFNYLLQKANFEVVAVKANGGMFANAGLTLIQAFERVQNPKTFKMKVFMSLYRRLHLKKKINKLFNQLDNNYYNDFNTINYVVIAQKK